MRSRKGPSEDEKRRLRESATRLQNDLASVSAREAVSIRSKLSQNSHGPRLGNPRSGSKVGNGRNSKERHFRSNERTRPNDNSDVSQELIM